MLKLAGKDFVCSECAKGNGLTGLLRYARNDAGQNRKDGFEMCFNGMGFVN
jgi:hypothetical protein